MKIHRLKFLLVIALLFAAPLLPAQSSTSAFDLVITNGHIIDGTGSPWYSGDVGIRDGKIAAIGNLTAAPRKRTIDAAGKVVAPGFIDMLGQSELSILVEPRLPSKIYQGITTEITGEGGSIAPLNDAIIQADRDGYEHYKITPSQARRQSWPGRRFRAAPRRPLAPSCADEMGAPRESSHRDLYCSGGL